MYIKLTKTWSLKNIVSDDLTGYSQVRFKCREVIGTDTYSRHPLAVLHLRLYILYPIHLHGL